MKTILKTVLFVLALGASTLYAAPKEQRKVSPPADTAECEVTHAIMNDIVPEMGTYMKEITTRCLQPHMPDVTLAITSPGGDMTTGIAGYELVKTARDNRRFTTIAYGQVASAAVLLFLSGTHRHITCNSHLMIHNHSSVMSGQMQMGKAELREQRNLSDVYHRTHVAIIAKVTNLSREKIEKMLDESTVLTAHEAVKLGFATKVIGTHCSK